jgi:glycosyltransferase involved in cell wall biosynthesis
MVRDAVGDVRLVLVGREDDPAYASSLRRMAAAAGLEGAIWWAGYVRDPLPIIAHSDALASASHTEAGPIALLEAMACGVPVVSTDCPAGPRYLTDEARAGLLVPMRDPGAMASAIIRVLTEPELRGELIASGRSRAAAFEPRRVAERYLAEAEALTRRAPITVAAGSRR